eukprot:10124723-Alexandrium_andersonii.AAC.1
MVLSAAPSRRTSEIPIPQVQAQKVPREARHLLRQGASPTFADSEPQRGRFGPLGTLGPPPPGAGF